ncbi:alpha,alpha-phosphotrehalase [Spiroplasma citri]|uniref:Alpha,alpha-phosphotrehalase n=1 Tax=Spiroplasma citri TaxID=2133 RepID=Q6XK11_SPICI|nr:alpha,alpha-phosphotrehalase [Spiroplasma citri]AAP55645.1 alpha-amylase [Spiroplasma citri]APE74372.1 Trehalose-6-phosphate hydrolase [Spiroplasma citri]QIA66587.1 alpha,alpha-phosphotrehalase [Spiroplasma citri]QIA68468.1 alpha,alpha-phosphotrehalase [Spiroplasma citri]QIA70343.1 alpha,alpha-phosphotrehalase [Spiroplasma citri]
MNKINFQEAIVYEIHPQSFYDSNHDGVGDLQGIIQKLDYLAMLGVNYLWLNPIYVSPQKDNGYDVSDYKNINPLFGTMNDFEMLVTEAGKRNIYIMMDMIFNHCSTEHEWFQKAQTGNLDYLQRFFFLPGDKAKCPNNWQSKFGGSVWEYHDELKMFYLHLFDKTQVDLNWKNESLRQHIYQIVNYWLQKGVRGLRFDVINLIGKPNIFENDLTGDGRKYYTDTPQVHTYLQEMAQNTYLKTNDIITVGELSSTSIKQAILYTKPVSQELNMAFTFHHLKIDYLNNEKWKLAPYDPAKLVAKIKEWQIPVQAAGGWLANFLNNHDQPRALSRFGDPENYRFESATALAAVVLLLRGTPYLYQGEEFGMENNNYTKIEQLKDVESINYYHILQKEGEQPNAILEVLSARSRDNARTPMQWNNQQFAGFSTHKPWIDVNTNYLKINWEKDYHSSQSIFKAYQMLIQLRKNNLAFSYGEIEFVEIDPTILSFYRYYEKNKFLVLINLSDQTIMIPDNLLSEKTIYNNYSTFEKKINPYQVIVFDYLMAKSFK